MRALLDANVLYPTVMRQVLLGVAERGLFTPLWSDRILKEWELAAAKHGAELGVVAQGEVALARARFPKASVPAQAGLERRLWLPDPDDVHVLASAIAGNADVLVTQNAKDFPRRELREEGVERSDADSFLMGLYGVDTWAVAEAVESVRRDAEQLSGEAWPVRRLLKKARLNRLGKALD